MKRLKFHCLRHTCATLLLGAREPLHVVSAKLGHANPTVALQVYAHALPDQQVSAARAIGNILHGSASKAGGVANG